MKIFLICSKRFYDRVPEVKSNLEKNGHEVTLPNSFDNPAAEAQSWELGPENHAKWKAGMLARSQQIIGENDAVLVLNFDKGEMKNYIGGATFLEMYDAFRLGKKIFLYNDVPEGILHDEIRGFAPAILNADLRKIVE